VVLLIVHFLLIRELLIFLSPKNPLPGFLPGGN